jgi:hypothetical protein
MPHSDDWTAGVSPALSWYAGETPAVPSNYSAMMPSFFTAGPQ